MNAVALGKTRAKQYSLLKNLSSGEYSEEECALGDKVMCVQLHGDASFTGQGVVMETLGLSEYYRLKTSHYNASLPQAISLTLQAEGPFTL